MNWKEFYESATQTLGFSDGSMGVFLQKYGLTGEDCPELWNIIHADIVEGVHRSYVEAGSNLIITNSLGGNRVKLADYGLADRLKEINEASVRVAKRAAGNRAIVAGDVAPTGLFIEPMGNTTFEEMVDIYREQISVLANAGADCIFFETHIDILELKAGIIACREVCDLPIIASVTFEKDGRTVTGSSPEAVFTTLEALGVDIMGTNCGTGPADMLKIIERIRGLFSVPIVAQANAGMPKIVDGRTVFDETPESYVVSALKMIKNGVNVIGGCCGTTPDHIKLMIDTALVQKSYHQRPICNPDFLKLSSRYRMHKIGFDEPFTVIGERLNPTARKKLAEDITKGEYILFKDEALAQERTLAHILDMNMGIPSTDEAALVKRGLEILSTTVQIPIAIDSSNPEAARLGMRLYPGKPLLNSISAESDRLALLPDVKRYGAAFIALPITEEGIPETAEKRVNVMRSIIDKAQKLGIDKRNILADPLVMTVSAQQKGAKVTLDTVRRFREELGLYTTMGLSNISFGLPARSFINRNFLSMAIANGLTSAIINPLDEEMMGMVHASDVLLSRDANSANYIELYSGKTIQSQMVSNQKTPVIVNKGEQEPATLADKLKTAVIKGNKTIIKPLIEEALKEGHTAFHILNEFMIPGINRVGELYDQRVYFLPQLMLSAETMSEGFSFLEPILKSQSDGKPRGKIVMATVKGDVHDIGKNIVVLMLKNHGFEVIDMGKDVPCEAILEKAIAEEADIVGLSALMTTTMPRMGEFMSLQKERGTRFIVMVGGAAVTRSFAESIGAHYSQDAVNAVKLAQSLIKR